MEKLTWADVEKSSNWHPGDGRGPSLAQFVDFINDNFPQFIARLEEWSGSFDRYYKGSRLRFPGKYRTCKKLYVYSRGNLLSCVYSHNPIEAYPCNSDVAKWIMDHKNESKG